MQSYIPWIVGGVAVIGAVVLISRRNEQLAPTNFQDNPAVRTPPRNTTQEILAGLGTLAGTGIAAYRDRSAQSERDRQQGRGGNTYEQNRRFDEWVTNRQAQ